MNILALAGDTWRHGRGLFPGLIRAAWFPGILSLVLFHRALVPLGPGNEDKAFAVVVGNWFLVSAFAVACHRLVLLPEAETPPLGIGIGRRELRYAWFAGLWLLASSAPLLAVLILALSDAFFSNTAGQIASFLLALVAGILALALILGRTSLGLPATALDQPGSTRRRMEDAWRLVRGNTWRLWAAALLVLVPVGVGAWAVRGILETLGHEMPAVLFEVFSDVARADQVHRVGGATVDALYWTIVIYGSVALGALLLSLAHERLSQDADEYS